MGTPNIVKISEIISLPISADEAPIYPSLVTLKPTVMAAFLELR